MSEETSESKPSKSTPAESETAAVPPAEVAIPAGHYGKLLEKKKITVTHLGQDADGVEMVEIPPADLLKAAEFLRDDSNCLFDLLVSVSSVDMKDYRLSVTHLYSLETHSRLAIKTRVDDQDNIPSLVPIWPAANWHEREAYDLMGINYEGHPDLRRILMPADWIGYPLRKDYVENDPRLIWNRR